MKCLHWHFWPTFLSFYCISWFRDGKSLWLAKIYEKFESAWLMQWYSTDVVDLNKVEKTVKRMFFLQIFEVFSNVVEYNQINHKSRIFPCNFAWPLPSGLWGWIDSGFQIHHKSWKSKRKRLISPTVSNALSIWWFKTCQNFWKMCR